MKTIKLRFLFATVLLCSIALSSCNLQEYDIQVPERVYGRLNVLQKDLAFEAQEGSLLFEYQVTGTREQVKLETKIANNRYHSVLQYRNDGLRWIDASFFDIDLQEVIDKKNMNIIIEKHAKTLKKKLDVKTVNRIADILEGIPEMLYNELGQKEYNNESTLSVFYHLAAFNTVRRSYEKRWSGDCQCGVNSSYLGNESLFFCAEDIMVSADWLYNFIAEKSAIKRSEGHQFNPKSLLKYLEKESGRLVSVSAAEKLLRDELSYFWKNINAKEKQQISNKNFTLPMVPTVMTRSEYDGWPIDPECWLYGVSSGGDCGCCSNYSGPCWECNLICLWHDLECFECNPTWLCGTKCQPGCPNFE